MRREGKCMWAGKDRGNSSISNFGELEEASPGDWGGGTFRGRGQAEEGFLLGLDQWICGLSYSLIRSWSFFSHFLKKVTHTLLDWQPLLWCLRDRLTYSVTQPLGHTVTHSQSPFLSYWVLLHSPTSNFTHRIAFCTLSHSASITSIYSH